MYSTDSATVGRGLALSCLAAGIRSATLLDLPLGLFAASVVVAVGAAYEPVSARDAAIWLAAWAALALAIGWLARSRRVWLLVAVAAVACGATAALVFVVHYSSLNAESKIHAIDVLGHWLSDPFPQWAPWLPYSNSAATWFEGLFLLGLGAASDPRLRRLRVALVVMSALLGLGLLLTMSRGAWVGVLAATAVVCVTRRASPGWRGVVAGGAVMAALLVGLAMTFESGLTVTSLVSTATAGIVARPDRLDIYRNSATLLDAVGLTGLGPGEQFADPFSRFALIIQVPFVTYPHQLSLHVWLAFGALGIMAWAWWVSAIAVAITSAERHPSSPAFRGAWAGFVAVLVHGLTDARQAVDYWTWGPFFVLAGLIVARYRRLEPRPFPSRFAVSGLCMVTVCMVVLARHTPLSAAWYSAVGHRFEARCLFGHPLSIDRAASCRLAIDAYARAVAHDPTQAAPRRRLAMAAADRGAFTEAVPHARAALYTDPGSLATRKVVGLVAAWAGEDQLARSLLATVPEAPAELLVWSEALKGRGHLVASENALRVALQLHGKADTRRSTPSP